MQLFESGKSYSILPVRPGPTSQSPDQGGQVSGNMSEKVIYNYSTKLKNFSVSTGGFLNVFQING
jgi:hypothetical protein